MKVIDSGWTEPAVSATVVGVEDDVALGAGVIEGAGEAVAGGVGRCTIGVLQPASSTIAATPPSRKASMVTVERACRYCVTRSSPQSGRAGAPIRTRTTHRGDNTVLAGIDLEVDRGSVFALLGPNGAGKTTMVRILGTLTRADAGEVRVVG
jgi:ABC-type multidrug transport system fused ATPase/permease subunit